MLSCRVILLCNAGGLPRQRRRATAGGGPAAAAEAQIFTVVA